MQSFTARMPLLTATSAFGLRKSRWRSRQQLSTLLALDYSHSTINFAHFVGQGRLLQNSPNAPRTWLECRLLLLLLLLIGPIKVVIPRTIFSILVITELLTVVTSGLCGVVTLGISSSLDGGLARRGKMSA